MIPKRMEREDFSCSFTGGAGMFSAPTFSVQRKVWRTEALVRCKGIGSLVENIATLSFEIGA